MEQDRFERLTAADIVAMAGDVEDRRLDCKTVESDAFTSASDKGNLAKAISGFANSEGGVILWGVSARKDNEGSDCIEGYPGVRNPQRILARLQELTSQATSPGVVGVVHRIPSANGVGLHFVATFVPQSDSGPHMAKLREDRYYQRIGSSMMRMEHFQIADMFGRRPHPEILFKFVQSDTDVLSVELRNAGRGIARAPYVMLKVRRPYIAAPYPETGDVKDFPLPRLPNASMPDWSAFVGGMDQVIHPGVTLRFRAITPPMRFQGQLPTICTVEYRIGAAGATEQTGSFEFNFQNGQYVNIGHGYGDW
jgi:hypothetical protein